GEKCPCEPCQGPGGRAHSQVAVELVPLRVPRHTRMRNPRCARQGLPASAFLRTRSCLDQSMRLDFQTEPLLTHARPLFFTPFQDRQRKMTPGDEAILSLAPIFCESREPPG